MAALFADTSYFPALLNPRDALYSEAVARSGAAVGHVVTTMWVVQELADGLCSPSHRGVFLRAFAAIEADPGTTLLPIDPGSWRRGLELYSRRPDKAWPLTDCISFVVMTDLGLSEALTGDHHCEQTGFRALLREA